MLFLLALIAFNILSVSLLSVVCGKKENENGAPSGTLDRGKTKTKNSETTVEFSFLETPKSRRLDVYHEVAENLAYPASIRCRNHDDAWRMLALYLDFIRSVNPQEFAEHRLLDAALAVLHDFGHYIRSGHISNDVMALAVVYFLVDFHKIKVNLGSPETPWYSVLSRNAQIEQLERMRRLIQQELVGSRSDETTVLTGF